MKKKIIFKFLIVSLLFLFSLVSLFSQDDIISQDNTLEKAKKYEAEKKIKDAIELYKEWLLQHYGNTNFIYILKHLVQLEDDSKNLMIFLHNLDSLCKKTDEKLIIAELLAQIEELHGNLSAAGKYYMYIYNNGSDEQRMVSLLYAAQIYFQQGMFKEAIQALEILNQQSVDTYIHAKAEILLSIIHVKNGELEKAKSKYISMIKKYKNSQMYPIILLSFIDFLNITGNDNEIKKIMNVFTRYFSLLPEYYLALRLTGINEEGRISYYPNPSYLLDYNSIKDDFPTPEIEEIKSEPKVVYIQTGSFLVKENAEDMIAALLKNNFTGLLFEKEMNQKLYYKVLVQVNSSEPDVVNNTILSLKDAGFEGFLVTGEN